MPRPRRARLSTPRLLTVALGVVMAVVLALAGPAGAVESPPLAGGCGLDFSLESPAVPLNNNANLTGLTATDVQAQPPQVVDVACDGLATDGGGFASSAYDSASRFDDYDDTPADDFDDPVDDDDDTPVDDVDDTPADDVDDTPADDVDGPVGDDHDDETPVDDDDPVPVELPLYELPVTPVDPATGDFIDPFDDGPVPVDPPCELPVTPVDTATGDFVDPFDGPVRWTFPPASSPSHRSTPPPVTSSIPSTARCPLSFPPTSFPSHRSTLAAAPPAPPVPGSRHHRVGPAHGASRFHDPAALPSCRGPVRASGWRSW